MLARLKRDGASDEVASREVAVEVRATDMLKLEATTIAAKRGTPVRLTLVKTGAMEHDWVVDNSRPPRDRYDGHADCAVVPDRGCCTRWGNDDPPGR